MTEQRIDPAIWRAVATELEQIASAEWPSYPQLVEALTAAVEAMPADCPQQIAIGCHELYGLAPGSIEAHRWLLRALAGALRADADGAEGQRGDCPHCNAALWPFETVCGFCGGTRE